MYVWRQSTTQVVIRIDVRAGVRVAQFVCEVDDGSMFLEIKKGDARKEVLRPRQRKTRAQCMVPGWKLVKTDLDEAV